MRDHGPAGAFQRIDARITRVLARVSVPTLRIGLGVVFLWFGALKFVPGLSPAEDLATRTIARLTGGAVSASMSLPILAAWEVLIGVGLLSGRFLRPTLLLLAVQMIGAIAPLALFPSETFTVFPYAPTLEGQYIIKNIVLIGAAMVIGSTVRGGRVVPEPDAADAAEILAATDAAEAAEPAGAPGAAGG